MCLVPLCHWMRSWALWIKEGIGIRVDKGDLQTCELRRARSILVPSEAISCVFKCPIDSIKVDQNASNYTEWPLGVIRLQHFNLFDQIESKSGVLRVASDGNYYSNTISSLVPSLENLSCCNHWTTNCKPVETGLNTFWGQRSWKSKLFKALKVNLFQPDQTSHN